MRFCKHEMNEFREYRGDTFELDCAASYMSSLFDLDQCTSVKAFEQKQLFFRDMEKRSLFDEGG